VSPRGIGSLISMFVVGRLVRVVENRVLLATGFGILAFSSWIFSNINLEIAMSNVAWPSLINGFATGFIFVPLTTMTMATLEKHEMGNATGLYNLMRNIGGSFGIATVTTLLARGSQVHQNFLVGHLAPGDLPFQQELNALSRSLTAVAGPVASVSQAYGIIYAEVVRQATLLAYVDNFRIMAALALACVPMVLLFRRRNSPSRSRTS
jgi:DHA2 family multidrug resistance protein